jgi:hypothetical protein
MDFKFNCEKCYYSCNYLSEWNEHLTTKKHTGEKRKERSDKILQDQCTFCEYKSNKTSNMKTHILTNHSTVEERKIHMKYYCEKCDFGTNAEILFKRHLETQKHLK